MSDDDLEFTANFKHYPEPSGDGETETITMRQIALGFQPMILIEADTDQDEPTFNVSISDMPNDVAAFLMKRLGSALAETTNQAEED